MKRITKNAYAKINLLLKITGKRPDGYHGITTTMHTISLCDKISVQLDYTEFHNEIRIFLECNDKTIPLDETNTMYKAAKLFYSGLNTDGYPATHIICEKHIPHQAGLGGGSADAAAVLNALNELYHYRYPRWTLRRIAAEIGADVPFCIDGGYALCRGIGDEITLLPSCKQGYVALFMPDFCMSTKTAYELFDKIGISGSSGNNDFESVYRKYYDKTDFIKSVFRHNGAKLAQLTGSGSCFYGIFTQKRKAHKSLIRLKQAITPIFYGIYELVY